MNGVNEWMRRMHNETAWTLQLRSKYISKIQKRRNLFSLKKIISRKPEGQKQSLV